MSGTIEMTVNGRRERVTAAPGTPLLYVLRNDLGLAGPKFGCGLGQCGACTVIVDGAAVFSCITPIAVLPGRKIRTIESLGTSAEPGPLQRAFIAEQAAQCGYCTSGMLIGAAALLARSPRPGEEEIRAALDRYLCRCGAHNRIVCAVQRAAAAMERT